MRVLAEPDWQGRARAHAKRVEPWIRPRLQRRRAGQRHPVDDFLFDYYHYSPAKLSRWQPGFGIALAGQTLQFKGLAGYEQGPSGLRVSELTRQRLQRPAESILRLLRATSARPAVTACFGLHEWAMVYRAADRRRHQSWPLRLGAQGTDEVVEQVGLGCTHFDAFRFFTDEAMPRNPVQLTRTQQVDMEQPGCLHAAMDLYKWAYRLAPVMDSDTITDGFDLARTARLLDMQASPYDLRDLGLEPVQIETAEGRVQYQRRQREIIERAALQRARLIDRIEVLFELEPGGS